MRSRTDSQPSRHQHKQHNARRAELHRLKEKHPEQYARLQAHAALRDDDDEQEEESTSEEEVRWLRWSACGLEKHHVQDDGFIAEETEAQILATLKKLRSKDPEIYDPSKRFFKDDDARDGDEAPAKAKKAKPMLLKDVLFQQVRAPMTNSSAFHSAPHHGEHSVSRRQMERTVRRRTPRGGPFLPWPMTKSSSSYVPAFSRCASGCVEQWQCCNAGITRTGSGARER